MDSREKREEIFRMLKEALVKQAQEATFDSMEVKEIDGLTETHRFTEYKLRVGALTLEPKYDE